MNRLVPNEGELMDRIEFFGGAVFVPVFLVSVGLILNPAVMVKGETLGLAGLFILACLGGKALAAQITARLFGFSRAQAGLLFSLSAAQAAATLAATVIGFQLGLFSSAVVNAVLVVIFVSVLASTIVGARASGHVASPQGPSPLGTRVVVGVADADAAAGALTIAHRIARADGGVVHPVLVVPEAAPFAPKQALARLREVVSSVGVDGQLMTIVDRSVLHGALRVGRAQEATLVLVADPPGEQDRAAAASPAAADRDSPAPPVALVRGNAARLGVVRTRVEADDAHGPGIVAEMARRVAGGPAQELGDDHDDWSRLLAPGDVTFVSAELGETLVGLPHAADGLVVSAVAEWLVREEADADGAPELPGDAAGA